MNTIVPLSQLISTAADEKKIENSFSIIDWPETFLDTAQALRFGNLSWVFQINLLQIQDTHVAPIKQHWLLKHPSCHTF